MPYSVIMIVAMLTCQSACGCMSSMWESSNIYLFIVSLLNIIIIKNKPLDT